MALFIGLMSGTSADGIDAVLVDLAATPRLCATYSLPFTLELRQQIHALCTSGTDEIERAGALDHELGELFAQASLALLEQAQIKTTEIHAIGSHGQTIRHRPPGTVAHPFTLQIGDPNIIAARTGITTVADFRRRDLALGGQGAPLVPAFHRAVFSDTQTTRAIVNIGGIANITWLAPGKPLLGFDTGPGNNLMDGWIQRHQRLGYDTGGDWARTGKVHQALLQQLLTHPYLALPVPKSTGREDFHLQWLDNQLEAFSDLAVADVQATLAALTVETIAQQIERQLGAQTPCEIYVCGGGARNVFLLEQLHTRLAPHPVATTTPLGIDPDWVEAAAFAWLAQQTLNSLPGNVPSVTGARASAVLGGIYPA